MGDHLHGSDAGLKAVGDSIDLSLFGGKGEKKKDSEKTTWKFTKRPATAIR